MLSLTPPCRVLMTHSYSALQQISIMHCYGFPPPLQLYIFTVACLLHSAGGLVFLYCTLDNELIDFIQSTPYFRAWRDEVWRCLCRALWPHARSAFLPLALCPMLPALSLCDRAHKTQLEPSLGCNCS